MRQWEIIVGISENSPHRLHEGWRLTSSSSSYEAIALNMLNVICKINIFCHLSLFAGDSTLFWWLTPIVPHWAEHSLLYVQGINVYHSAQTPNHSFVNSFPFSSFASAHAPFQLKPNKGFSAEVRLIPSQFCQCQNVTLHHSLCFQKSCRGGGDWTQTFRFTFVLIHIW